MQHLICVPTSAELAVVPSWTGDENLWRLAMMTTTDELDQTESVGAQSVHATRGTNPVRDQPTLLSPASS